MKKNLKAFTIILLIFINVSCSKSINFNFNAENTINTIDEGDINDTYKKISILFENPMYPVMLRGYELVLDNLNMRLEEINNYMEKAYRIIVKLDLVFSAEYQTEMQKRLLAGDNTDIYFMHNNLQDIVDNNYAVDISNLINRFYPEINYMFQQDPCLRSKISKDDKIYAIPGCANMDLNLNGLVINRNFYDIQDKNRFLEIDEVMEIFKRLENSNENYNGVLAFAKAFNTIMQNDILAYVLSPYIIYTNSEFILMEESDYFNQTYNRLKNLYELSLNVSERQFDWSMNWTEPTKVKSWMDVSNAPVAPVVELVEYSTFRRKIYFESKKFNDHYYVMPVKTNNMHGRIVYDAKYFISVYSDETVAAMQFLRCLEYDETIYELLRYGIKDIDYENTDSGIALNTRYYINNILNPLYEKKLAHDFNLWDEYIYDLVHIKNAEVKQLHDDVEYINSIVKDLITEDASFKNAVYRRFEIYNLLQNHIKKADSFIYDFLSLFDKSDNQYIIEKINQNIS